MRLLARLRSWIHVSVRRGDFERGMHEEMQMLALSAAILLLLVVAATAASAPARRASRIDPAVALRYE